jgi:hypothetical protein
MMPWIRSRGIGLTILGLALAAVSGVRAAPNDAARSVFADVPRTHPAYAATAYLQDELGVFTGFPAGTFGGKRAISRYEFTIALQRMHHQIRGVVVRLESKSAAKAGLRLASSTPGPPAGDERRLHQTFKDAEKIRRMLGWHEALLTEFAAELPMLGQDMELLDRDMKKWKENAREYAARARVVFEVE